MPPPFLYRYRPINDYSVWEIEHNAIYLQRLDQQNDISEGVYKFDASDTWVIRRRLARNALDERKILYALLLFFIPKTWILESVAEHRGELKDRQDWGLVCFSERCNNDHMWENYASKHTGIVLEYELSGVAIPKNALRKVQYADRPPVTMRDIFKDNEGGFFELLSYKEAKWSPEEEWRLLAPIDREDPNNPKRIFGIPLRRVILGLHVSDEDRKSVAQAIARSGDKQLQLAQYVATEGSESDFKLRDEPITRILTG